MKATYEFEIGDVVMLKSGGPFMTITSISDGIANCLYFTNDNDAELCGYEFPTTSLVFLNDD